MNFTALFGRCKRKTRKIRKKSKLKANTTWRSTKMRNPGAFFFLFIIVFSSSLAASIRCNVCWKFLRLLISYFSDFGKVIHSNVVPDCFWSQYKQPVEKFIVPLDGTPCGIQRILTNAFFAIDLFLDFNRSSNKSFGFTGLHMVAVRWKFFWSVPVHFISKNSDQNYLPPSWLSVTNEEKIADRTTRPISDYFHRSTFSDFTILWNEVSYWRVEKARWFSRDLWRFGVRLHMVVMTFFSNEKTVAWLYSSHNWYTKEWLFFVSGIRILAGTIRKQRRFPRKLATWIWNKSLTELSPRLGSGML